MLCASEHIAILIASIGILYCVCQSIQRSASLPWMACASEQIAILIASVDRQCFYNDPHRFRGHSVCFRAQSDPLRSQGHVLLHFAPKDIYRIMRFVYVQRSASLPLKHCSALCMSKHVWHRCAWPLHAAINAQFEGGFAVWAGWEPW